MRHTHTVTTCTDWTARASRSRTRVEKARLFALRAHSRAVHSRFALTHSRHGCSRCTLTAVAITESCRNLTSEFPWHALTARASRSRTRVEKARLFALRAHQSRTRASRSHPQGTAVRAARSRAALRHDGGDPAHGGLVVAFLFGPSIIKRSSGQ